MSNYHSRKRKSKSSSSQSVVLANPPSSTTEEETSHESTKSAVDSPASAQDLKSKEATANFYLPVERRSLWLTDFLNAVFLPYRLIKRNWRDERIHLFAVFALVLLLYGITTPRLVTLEDDGLFIANLKFFGVAHPPGYPIHTFLGGVFYHLLPFGTPAFKGHFFSSFAGAIACAAIYAIVIMMVRGRLFGYMAGLAYGASRTFWSQAIIAEVYTLNSMFFFIVLALCLYYSSHIGKSNRSHIRLLCVIAFVYGLGVANHYPLLGLGTTGLIILVLSQWKNILIHSPKAIACFLLGAAPPYAWMVWRSFDLTPANFYGPIDTWDRFIFYISRSGYAGVDSQSGVGIDDKIIFSKFLGNEMLWQFTPIGFALVAVGFLIMMRTRYNWVWASLTFSWFTSSLLLLYLLDFKAEFIWLAAFKVYHILAYGIMAIWLAIGSAWLLDRFPKLSIKAKEHCTILLVVIVVGGSVFAHWDTNYRRNYSWAHDLAIAKLNTIEPNAIVFLFDDLDLPVGYLHYVEGIRPDLDVYNDQGLVYGKRLYSPLLPDFPHPQQLNNKDNKVSKLRALIDSTTRPIYYHPNRRSLYEHPRYGSDLISFFRRVNRENKQERVIFSDSLRQWIDEYVDAGENITDLWTLQQQHGTITQIINIVQIAESSGYPLDDVWQEIIERARENNIHVRIMTTSQRINSRKMSKDDMKDELNWMNNYDIDKEEFARKEHKALFFTLKSVLIDLLEGRKHPGYEENLLEAIRRFPDKTNTAIQEILELYTKNNQYCEAKSIVERVYKKSSEIPKNLLRPVRLIRKKAVGCPENTLL